jgi:hypothetical protein
LQESPNGLLQGQADSRQQSGIVNQWSGGNNRQAALVSKGPTPGIPGAAMTPEVDPRSVEGMDQSSGDKADQPSSASAGSRRWLVSVIVSAAALFLAVVHLLRPKLNIDAITIVLIVVAALPWLGSVFKAIDLPGGWRVEYRELRRQQQQVRHELARVQDSVKKVEQVIFSREVSPDVAQRLREQIGTFHQYLAALGLEPFEREPPRIGLNSGAAASFYVPSTHQIEINPDLADNRHVVFREYCNYVLSPDLGDEFLIAAYDLISGLSFYFPCSFTGDREGFSYRGVNLNDSRQMISRRGLPSPDNQPRAYIWASIFWEARQLMDPRVEDKLLADAWLEVVKAASGSSPPSDKRHRPSYHAIEGQFIQRMYGLAYASLQPEGSHALAELLMRRRVPAAKPSSAIEP